MLLITIQTHKPSHNMNEKNGNGPERRTALSESAPNLRLVRDPDP